MVLEGAGTRRPRSPRDTGGTPPLTKRRNKELATLSKTYGHIPGIPVFTVWETRQRCSNAAVHRPLTAGIAGNAIEGVFSIVLSGGYEDDEDMGDAIIYTGAGGRQQWSEDDPPKRLRLGPQTLDQSWDRTENKALMRSLNTGEPVRVIRSSKCRSIYAPPEGCRYDGLYRIVNCWTDIGKNQRKICRCRLERIPGQPPIPELVAI